ncbi:peptidase S41 [Actinomadura sp. NBRC 104425]|uniref:S41 family peptidase n=1 Tax=Actinomadura sp. NBRC 104425 TaxID=3032204 RepID=UPI0024A3573E|nr:S41 family peptidase [Actinomadura sp. NBRC 104425]GLZ10272.1 peptidase S41 [Actinomadura sp. NBRC 104425]
MFRLTGRGLRVSAVVVAVVCAYAAGMITGGGPPAERRARGSAGTSLLEEAATRIGRAAAQPVDRGALDRAAIDGMLRTLGDKWARYYSASEFDDFQGRMNGRYSGVGLWLGTGGGGVRSTSAPDGSGDRRVRVASVQPGSAAERAGVRVGDVITKVGDADVAGWDAGRVAAALRGRQGTGVELSVDRDGEQRRFHLVRSPVAGSDVTVADLADRARMIRIGAFTRGVGRAVRGALTGASGRPRGGVLLDLRGNPGGLLDEAVETASAFLPGGPVVTYERRGERGMITERRDVTRPGDAEIPLVVLVDAGTASAAEVVAGSLRDRDRAVIVGSRTYGKGSVQEPIRLADGSAIELTVGRYRTPSGRNLDGVGIDPDVAVSADRPPKEAERRAQEVLRGLLAAMPEPRSGDVLDKDRG